MSRRVIPRIAWALGVLSVLVGVAMVAMMFVNHSAAKDLTQSNIPVDVVHAVAFALVGALVAARRPRNAIGWMLCAMGLSEGLSSFAIQYATYTLVTRPGALPGGIVWYWLGTWIFVPGTALALIFLPLFYPNGHVPSAAWRPVAWLSAISTVIATVVLALLPWSISQHPPVPITNPFEVAIVGRIGPPIILGVLVIGAIVAVSAILSLIARYRRANGDEREQLKWFAFGCALLIGTVLAELLIPLGPTGTAIVVWAQAAALLALAGALGVAILKYHLYDIDRLINRTLVYGALSASLGLTYAGGVLLLQSVFAPLVRESDLAVAGSTLLVAALFQPARRRGTRWTPTGSRRRWWVWWSRRCSRRTCRCGWPVGMNRGGNPSRRARRNDSVTAAYYGGMERGRSEKRCRRRIVC